MVFCVSQVVVGRTLPEATITPEQINVK